MSSTNRGAERQPHDYYRTPVLEIVKFIQAWRSDIGTLPEKILDPCVGGEIGKTEPSYPAAFKLIADWSPVVFTLDIRPDAVAQYCGDYLDPKSLIGFGGFDAIIFNPPFSLAQQFIQKAISEVRPNGFVVALCRLNFLGSDKRNAWLRHHPPAWIYVHGKRMSFTPDGKTDSIEYAHFVWEKEPSSAPSKLRLLKY